MAEQGSAPQAQTATAVRRWRDRVAELRRKEAEDWAALNNAVQLVLQYAATGQRDRAVVAAQAALDLEWGLVLSCDTTRELFASLGLDVDQTVPRRGRPPRADRGRAV